MARSTLAQRRAQLRARLAAALMFYCAWREPPRDAAGLLLLAALALQGRLLCNRLDGLVARQAQMVGRAGEVYNEAPDRLSDVVVCLGMG